MKSSKTLLGLVAVVASTLAQAQDATVSAEKKAPLQQLLPGAYGLLEVRHATNEQFDVETDTRNVIPYLDLRPTVGSTFYNGKLDTAFTWIFRKNPDSVRIVKHDVGFYNETTYTVFQNDYVKFFPYLYVQQGSIGSNSFALVDVGPHVDVKTSFKTDMGELTLSGFVEPLAEFYSGAGAKQSAMKKVKNSTDDTYTLAPSDTAQTEIEQKDPSLLSTTELALSFVPAKLSGLNVSLAANYLQNWTPRYEDPAGDADINPELAGYETNDAVMNKFTLSYKLNDSLTLANSARYTVGGAYEKTYDKDLGVSGVSARFENRLTLTATLF